LIKDTEKGHTHVDDQFSQRQPEGQCKQNDSGEKALLGQNTQSKKKKMKHIQVKLLVQSHLATNVCPWLSARCQQNTFRIHSNADTVSTSHHVQDSGLCLERNSVMAETTAFVLLGVKTSALLAPLRQNQV
ncbi:hypothetical protein STEG23_033634, partial [Scotinomys teguina]